MGVVCTTTNKKNNQKKEPKELDSNITNNKTEKILNEINNNLNSNNTVTKNTNKISSLKEYKFYLETYDKNDFFIVSNFQDLKFSATFERLYKKWEEILLFTRRQKKFSYRNLNQNHNFIIRNTIQRKTSSNISNKETNINSNINNIEDNNNNNNNINNLKNDSSNNNLNLNIQDDPNWLNLISNKDNLTKLTLGRGSLIENFIGRNADYSNLIQKFQIAFYFNKYRYIKYLSKGPPNNIRWSVWIALALCQSNHDFISEQKYLELVSKYDKNFIAFEEEQIKKDLNRSNSENKEFFCNKNSLDSLYNILKALAIEDPELGYCQGMNILAANFLMISDGNEYETFNMLRFIFKHLELREFFLNGFPKLIMYLFILKEFIRENLPKLFAKILELDIPEETWIFKWLQTLYNLTLPLSISIRLIDCLLCFGLEFLLNFSLAFIKCFEKKLLLCEDINDFLNIFKIPDIINPNILLNNNNNNIVSSHSSILNNKNEISEVNKENEISNTSLNKLNKTPDKKKDKKENSFCFNFKSPIKDIKQNTDSNTNNNNNNNNKIINNTKNFKTSNIKNIKSDSLKPNNIQCSGKKENFNSYSNNNNIDNPEGKKSSTTFNNDNNKDPTKYKINSQDELLFFREKLITNAKKIDLKEAIKLMIDNYTKENMDCKNKFNDNESSTGDGINEDKSDINEIENSKNNNNNIVDNLNKLNQGNHPNNTSNDYSQSIPYKITYKISQKDDEEIREKIDNILHQDIVMSSNPVSNKKHSRKSQEKIRFDDDVIICEEKDEKTDYNAYVDDAAEVPPSIADKFFSKAKQATNEKSQTNLIKKGGALDPLKINCSNSKEDFEKKPISVKNFPSSSKHIHKKKSDFINKSNYNNHPFSFTNNKNEINNNNNNKKADPYFNDINNQEINSNKNFSYRFKNFFSNNYDDRTSNLYRFSLNSIQSHSFTPRGLSIAQISLMNNIQEKLDVIRKIDCLEKEENENENDESNLEINSNVDEDFDSGVEWEKRSKINRNINVISANTRRMSACFSPQKSGKKKFPNNSDTKNIIENIENEIDRSLEIENELLYMEDESFGCSLYENKSDFEFFETRNKDDEHSKIKINKSNSNSHFKSGAAVINSFSLVSRRINESSKINLVEENPKKKNYSLNLNGKTGNGAGGKKEKDKKEEKNISRNEHPVKNNFINVNNSSQNLNDFDKSMDMKRKGMKSFVNYSDEKKALLNNLGIENKDLLTGKNKVDSHENKNFLHIIGDSGRKDSQKIIASKNSFHVNKMNDL